MMKTDTVRTGISKDQFTEMVRKKAYELYEKRGSKPGYAMNDWIQAERIIKQKML